MVRYCLMMILTLPLIGQAQKFSAADLKLLKLYSTGSFSNEVQAKADTHFIKTTLKMQPIWQQRKDGIWMFAEKADTAQRYQVWHFYKQDDTTMVLQFLDFKEKQKALQVSQDVKQQANLNLYNLFTRHGCEVYLKKNKSSYAGSSEGKDCFLDIPGTEYFSYKAALTKNSISLLETGFNKDDKQVMGSTSGAYNFIKKIKSLK